MPSRFLAIDRFEVVEVIPLVVPVSCFVITSDELEELIPGLEPDRTTSPSVPSCELVEEEPVELPVSTRIFFRLLFASELAAEDPDRLRTGFTILVPVDEPVLEPISPRIGLRLEFVVAIPVLLEARLRIDFIAALVLAIPELDTLGKIVVFTSSEIVLATPELVPDKATVLLRLLLVVA